MLNNIYEFQKIHLHTQRIMYFLPLVFIETVSSFV